MTGSIAPIRSIAQVRRRRREDAAPRAPAEGAAIELSIRVAAAPPPRAQQAPPASLDAHLLAQDAQLRGLKGGQERLESARSAYLGAEFSGERDRRPPKGLITRKDV